MLKSESSKLKMIYCGMVEFVKGMLEFARCVAIDSTASQRCKKALDSPRTDYKTEGGVREKKSFKRTGRAHG
jgi:hypothetical protein